MNKASYHSENALRANWHAPANIHCLSTKRLVDLEKLTHEFNLPNKPVWLTQVHSNICVRPEESSLREADALVTSQPDCILAIKTADCLPIMLCNTKGTEVAAIHGGWRGLLGGIIENTLQNMHSPSNTLIAWMGPAICKQCFEVGSEVPEAFIEKYPFVKTAFTPLVNGKCFGNLVEIASLILKQHHVNTLFYSDMCTFEEKNQFFSYRREKQTGRIASLIWFNQPK